MQSLRNKSKFLGILSKSLSQVAFESKSFQFRGYANHAGDEDIKWQWSVRDTPCQVCYKYKTKKGLITKLFGRKQEELTNKHKIVEYRPKIWELEYYDYLFPKCEGAGEKVTISSQVDGKQKDGKRRDKFMVCGQDKDDCLRKQTLNVEYDDELKPCTEKLQFDLKQPFCLNKVCGKDKPPKKDTDGEKEFVCFNYLIDKAKSTNETNGKDKDQCS